VDLLTIPLGIRPKFFHVSEDNLHVVWPKLTTSLTGVQSNEHESVYPLDWLKKHAYPSATTNGTGIANKELPIKSWGSDLDIDNITTPLEDMLKGDIMQTKLIESGNVGLKDFLTKLEQNGIAFVSGLPVDEVQTEKFINLLFPVLRNTHYGTFWKFTADFKHGDLAYSNQALAPHTDTTYFTDPVGLQMWHLLEHKGTGGTSLYIDGFNVAEQLSLSDPRAYKVLSETKIATHAAGDATSLFYPPLTRRYPILNHDPITGKLIQIRFNMEDRSVIDYLDGDALMEYYSALRSWQRLLSDDTNMGWIQLPPGSLVVVNNWRVLHGRSGFVGKRTMCGAYVSMDDYKNRVRLSVEAGKAKEDL
jgi:trimethyllysine dioxygenase